MLSKYGILCEVADRGSFSAVAAEFGYAQSSVSQAVKAVEDELGTCLIDRKRRGITWTADGLSYEPYLRAIYTAEQALERKKQEMAGLEKAVIRIGTFTSVSRETLPQLMTVFKTEYPNVRFELHQGEYDNIHEWLESGFVDLGFLAMERASQLDAAFLYEDEMLAVIPPNHPLAACETVTLSQLAEEPFILLDEGRYSTPLCAFASQHLTPQVEYRVYDDYSILSMVKSGLGVSLLFGNVVRGYETDVAVRPVREPVTRRIALACRDKNTLPYSVRRFRAFAIRRMSEGRE